ncbi:hypothetical protein OHA70_12055 [Kribbella sp. NBC_00382]|uniref:hypothetical protein n=1 Tax=Kribbella sp. NBC_00382 TaxID=2975967 RepID=UPI002E21380F
MTSHDLKDLLQTMAADGTDRVSVDEQTLIPRIRSRRRRRTGIAAAIAASTAVVVAAGAYAVLPGSEEPPAAAPAPVRPTVTLAPDGVRGFACGGALTSALAGDPALRFDPATPVATRDATGRRLRMEFKLTNTSDKSLDLFGTPYGPWVVVVKDGIVVGGTSGEAQPGKSWPLTPGQTVSLESGFSAYRCTPGAAEGTEPLAPGSYQVYAYKDFTHNTDTGRDKVIAAGGPWTVELK